jgi:hypothetical protein
MSNDDLDMFAPDDPHKLARTDAPATSKASANKVDTAKLKELVFEQVKAQGENGLTAKELVAANPDHHYSSLTARPASLEQEGRIFYLGDKRDGSRIMRSVECDRGFRVCGKCQGVLTEFYNYECQRCNGVMKPPCKS